MTDARSPPIPFCVQTEAQFGLGQFERAASQGAFDEHKSPLYSILFASRLRTCHILPSLIMIESAVIHSKPLSREECAMFASLQFSLPTHCRQPMYYGDWPLGPYSAVAMPQGHSRLSAIHVGSAATAKELKPAQRTAEVPHSCLSRPDNLGNGYLSSGGEF